MWYFSIEAAVIELLFKEEKEKERCLCLLKNGKYGAYAWHTLRQHPS